MRADILNGGAFSRSQFLAINQTATAGGAGDNTEVNTVRVSRKNGAKGMAMSCKVVIAYTTTLTAAQTLRFLANLQDAASAAGVGEADFGAPLLSTVVATGAGTVTGTVELDFSLSGAKEFVRAQITPDLSAGATDTVNWSAVVMMYGYQANPVSDTRV